MCSLFEGGDSGLFEGILGLPRKRDQMLFATLSNDPTISLGEMSEYVSSFFSQFK
jgi:hypothetical protein